jgi:NHLM bacteriocin system ABC transporter ATP-binding protein
MQELEYIENGSIQWYLQPLDKTHLPKLFLELQAPHVLFDLDSTKLTDFQIISHKSLDFQTSTKAFDTTELKKNILHWVHQCVRSLEEQSSKPKSFLSLDLKKTHYDADQNILNSYPLVWIKITAGNAYLFGQTHLPPLPQHTFFPLVEGFWFTTSEQLNFSIHDDLFEWPLRLQAFHSWLKESLAYSFQKFLENESFILQEKNVRDRSIFLKAIEKLTSVLSPFSSQTQQNEMQTLWKVCHCIGNEIGTTIPALHEKLLRDSTDPLETILRASRMRRRRVRLRNQWWKRNHGPLLAFNKENRPIALIPTQHGHYRIYDPVSEKSQLLTAKNVAFIQSEAWFLYRSFPAKLLSFRDLLSFSQHHTFKDWLRILTLSLLLGFFSLFIPYAFGLLVSILFSDIAQSQLFWLVLILMGSAIAGATCQFVQTMSLLKMQGMADHSLQTATWDRLLRLPIPFFRNYRVGDLGLRALGIHRIRVAFTGNNLVAILNIFLIAFYFIFIVIYSPSLGLMTGILLLLLFGISWIAAWKILPFFRKEAQLNGAVTSRVLELINGIAKIRTAARQSPAFALWAKDYATQQKNTFQSQVISSVIQAITSAFPFIATLFLFLLFSHTFKNILTAHAVSYFMAISVAFGSLIRLTVYLSQTLLSMLDVVPLYERLKPILETLPEVDEQHTDPSALNGEIETQNLSFRYAKGSPIILRKISIHIHAGEYVAIVGASGSGKSTFLRLLLGFEHAEHGTIFYDNKNLATLDIIAVRRQIGIVLQTGKLTMDTIFNNVAGALPHTLEEVWEALSMAGLKEIVEALPMGVHTFVSEEGGMLSGGEKQRLLIARALIGKPPILFFDEATSALDNRSQAIIANTLQMQNSTRIVLAHRLSTIKQVDRIFVFKNGSVVESGTFDELLKSGIEFPKLAKRQLI